ncbi:hypothetical protein ACO1O0_002032 [Amphichorda felina]
MAPPPSKPPIPAIAKPRFGTAFDPWNSSATGHQRPETQPGATTGWRESRNRKINSQFRAGPTGGDRLSDTWGAGAEDWDARIGAVVPRELRQRYRGGKSVVDMLVRPGAMKGGSLPAPAEEAAPPRPGVDAEETLTEARREEDEQQREEARGKEAASRGIFHGVVVHVNGSTYPLVSDHKLKHILSENGGQMSLHLGRRKVTHVILGRPASSGHGASGAGGGLAGGKLEREIRKVGGCGIKFVGVEW